MPSKENLIRIDFVQKIEWTDDKTRTFKGVLIPNPERYEMKMIDGIQYLYDKFDDLLFPLEETMNSIVEGMKKHPWIYAAIPVIENIDVYISDRIPKIRDFLDGNESKYEFKDKSEEFLAQLEKDHEMKFVILCIDLKGSTKLSQDLSSQVNANLIALFSREMAALVVNYKGFVLKYVGDGLIAFFPEPNFIGMNDIAVDCAVAMKLVIENAINKILEEKGLPELKFRIGLDSGEAIVKTIGDSSVKQHKDLIGSTINLAAKIQAVAQENQIVIGDTTVRNLHVSRRKLFRRYTATNWDYRTSPNDAPYQLHSMG